MGLMDLLQQALGGNAENHFDQVAQQAPQAELGAGLAEAMRSDQTPPFGNMVSQMFGQSSPQQQAGALGQSQITPEQASQLSPDQVREIAAQAEQTHPGVIDQMSQFYAQHSGLIKTLGGAALAIALAKMKNNMEQR